MLLGEFLVEIHCHNMHNDQAALKYTLVTFPTMDTHWMRRGTNMGAWLLIPTSTVNGVDMGVQE